MSKKKMKKLWKPRFNKELNNFEVPLQFYVNW